VCGADGQYRMVAAPRLAAQMEPATAQQNEGLDVIPLALLVFGDRRRAHTSASR